jgi:hypothetical protein
MTPAKRKRRLSNEAPDSRNWKERFYKTVPMMDANGDPLPQDPAMNKDGFWVKPKTTSDILISGQKKRRRS